ncbi:hypothetical protein DDF84_032345 (plasmid) [Cupriavidus metallidurans]|uniref:Uncharacterized protein n=2 Tax=Cupriavidus metallidurans TaxID=119219 RepID=A0A482J2Y4_9BURK|nr:hypothetical protein DDF84_032345 [Cupriavidus metallidurans]
MPLCNVNSGETQMHQQLAVRQASLSVEAVISKQVRLYDNGGKTLDRYTAVYLFDRERTGMYGARGMNESPFHGIGAYCSAAPGRHLGRRVSLADLPSDCQRLVRTDVGSFIAAQTESQAD